MSASPDIATFNPGDKVKLSAKYLGKAQFGRRLADVALQELRGFVTDVAPARNQYGELIPGATWHRCGVRWGQSAAGFSMDSDELELVGDPQWAKVKAEWGHRFIPGPV